MIKALIIQYKEVYKMKKKKFFLFLIGYTILISSLVLGVLAYIHRRDKGMTGGDAYISFDKYYGAFPENGNYIDINIILNSNLFSDKSKEVLKKDMQRKDLILQHPSTYSFLFVRKNDNDCIIAVNSKDSSKSLILEKGFSYSWDDIISDFNKLYSIEINEFYGNLSKKNDDKYIIYYYTYYEGKIYIINNE